MFPQYQEPQMYAAPMAPTYATPSPTGPYTSAACTTYAAPAASPIMASAPAVQAYAPQQSVTFAPAAAPAPVTTYAAPVAAPGQMYTAPAAAPVYAAAPTYVPTSASELFSARPAMPVAGAPVTYEAPPQQVTYAAPAAPAYEPALTTYAAPAQPAQTYAAPQVMYQQAAQPVYQQAAQPVYQQAAQPVYQQVAQPVYQQAAAQPVYQQAAQPVYQQAAQPVYQQAVASPIVQPAQPVFQQQVVQQALQQVFQQAPMYQQPMYQQISQALPQMVTPHAAAQFIQQGAMHGGMNQNLSSKTDSYEDDTLPPQPLTGRVHVLICGIDYSCDHVSWAGPPPTGHGPLDTKYAFDMMIDLAKRSHVASMKTLWNQQCTQQGVTQAIYEVGAQCRPGDYFVFYYTGHGDQLPNHPTMGNPHEDEEMDQCFCLVDARGVTDGPSPDINFRSHVWMRDDHFAQTIINATHDQAKILVLCDCCHSGTICDFTPKSQWAIRKQAAISISGCEDTQTSAGTGKGGMFTRALTKAIQDLNQSGAHSYNVSSIFNRTLMHYQQSKQAGHTQQISIHGCMLRPNQMPWPLQPKGHYQSLANTQYRGLHLTH